MSKLLRRIVAWELERQGYKPVVFEGHWGKGSWNNYIQGYYKGSVVRFEIDHGVEGNSPICNP